MSLFLDKLSNAKIAWSIVLGLFISSVGLPGLPATMAPDVLALIIFYWGTIGVSSRPKMGTVFLLGLFVDFSTGVAIGMHSLKYVLMLTIAIQLGNRFQMSPVLKQIALIVLVLLALEILLGGFVWIFLKIPLDIKSVIVAAMWGLVWPLVAAALDKNYSRTGAK